VLRQDIAVHLERIQEVQGSTPVDPVPVVRDGASLVSGEEVPGHLVDKVPGCALTHETTTVEVSALGSPASTRHSHTRVRALDPGHSGLVTEIHLASHP